MLPVTHKAVLCVTATDTAPLCGAHKKAGIRTILQSLLKLNIILRWSKGSHGAVARTLAKYDKAMTPLLSYASAHYVRLFVSVKKGIKEADESLKEMGFLSHCFNCGDRKWKFGLAVHLEEKCTVCGHTTSLAGPLWFGRLHEWEFCEKLLAEIEKREFKEALKLIAACRMNLRSRCITTFIRFVKRSV